MESKKSLSYLENITDFEKFLLILQTKSSLESCISIKSMKTVYYPDTTAPASHVKEVGRYAATIGFFDGVHRGHQSVIEQLCSLAQERQLQAMVITFEHHPRQVLHAEWQPQLLSSLDEKAELLAKTGIDKLVVLRFDETMAQLSAQQFMEQVLKRDLQVQLLLTGYDNRFGHDRTADFNDYVQYGKAMGMEVVCGQPLDVEGQRVSSSLVRRQLAEGKVAQAAVCLGRPYAIPGQVVHGEQIGRQLGFPTANLQPDDACRLVPANGVYVVLVKVEGQLHQGIMNIGTRPTFGGHTQTLEINIFDFIGNLYHQRMTISFIERLRDEQHFHSPEALVEQMHRDVEQAKAILSNYHNHYE